MLSSNTSAVSGDANYIEDVFSTYLYTGNDGTQNIVNGIDLATKGGMVWNKDRTNAYNHYLFETDIGRQALSSNLTQGLFSTPSAGTDLASYNTDGFTVGPPNTTNINGSGRNYASWTFRKQPKFFDVVTYTGNGTAGRTVAHSLGSVPGCVIVKQTSSDGNNWKVYHRSLGGTKFLNLSSFTSAGTDITYWNNTDPTSTVFTVGDDSSVNANGSSYVAYIFAHNAGGFGLTGTDNVITCGSWSGNGSTQDINLGFEPQYILLKNTTSNYNWTVVDTMRGMDNSSSSWVYANTSAAEASNTPSYLIPTATGFTVNTATPTYNASGSTYIYIAIRRGPMKVPTDGTKVYQTSSRSSTAPAWTSGFPVDLFFQRTTGSDNWAVLSRLTGSGQLRFNTTDAETTATEFKFDWMNGVNGSLYNASNDRGWMMKRAPSFLDEVILNNSTSTYTHNLTVAPELIFVKCRNASGANWVVYSKSLSSPTTKYLNLNTTGAEQLYGTGAWSTSATQFSVDTGLWANGSSGVAYLFATCDGVSKVGSYTGNGSTQAIACGFAGGARFVLIKRTDSTGDWYLYDTARGMTTLTDPYLLMNSSAAESATLGSVTTTTGGFTVDASILAAVNTNAASYIFLAIA